MKRFKWPLQRLLDVTERRELALRAALFTLSREMVQLRQRILRRQVSLRTLLDELAGQEAEHRLRGQELVLACSGSARRELAAMRQALAGLEARRSQKTQELMKIRSSRQTLEKLRQQALDRYRLRQQALEQKELDEAAQVAHVRRRLAAAGAGGAGVDA